VADNDCTDRRFDLLGPGTFVIVGLPDGMLGTAWPAMRHSFGVPVGDLGLILLVSGQGLWVKSERVRAGTRDATDISHHSGTKHRLESGARRDCGSTAADCAVFDPRSPLDTLWGYRLLERERFFVDVGVVDAEFVQGAADGCGHAGRPAQVDVTFSEVAKQVPQGRG
jgi:hypothetical protein